MSMMYVLLHGLVFLVKTSLTINVFKWKLKTRDLLMSAAYY